MIALEALREAVIEMDYTTHELEDCIVENTEYIGHNSDLIHDWLE